MALWDTLVLWEGWWHFGGTLGGSSMGWETPECPLVVIW